MTEKLKCSKVHFIPVVIFFPQKFFRHTRGLLHTQRKMVEDEKKKVSVGSTNPPPSKPPWQHNSSQQQQQGPQKGQPSQGQDQEPVGQQDDSEQREADYDYEGKQRYGEQEQWGRWEPRGGAGGNQQHLGRSDGRQQEFGGEQREFGGGDTDDWSASQGRWQEPRGGPGGSQQQSGSYGRGQQEGNGEWSAGRGGQRPWGRQEERGGPGGKEQWLGGEQEFGGRNPEFDGGEQEFGGGGTDDWSAGQDGWRQRGRPEPHGGAGGNRQPLRSDGEQQEASADYWSAGQDGQGQCLEEEESSRPRLPVPPSFGAQAPAGRGDHSKQETASATTVQRRPAAATSQGKLN